MNINQLMKQAQTMQKKLQEEQEKLAEMEFTGESGAKMVQIVLSGKNEMKSIKIDPSLLNEDEVDILEDLIIAAFSNAKEKLDSTSKDNLSGMMPAGMKMPF